MKKRSTQAYCSSWDQKLLSSSLLPPKTHEIKSIPYSILFHGWKRKSQLSRYIHTYIYLDPLKRVEWIMDNIRILLCLSREKIWWSGENESFYTKGQTFQEKKGFFYAWFHYKCKQSYWRINFGDLRKIKFGTLLGKNESAYLLTLK